MTTALDEGERWDWWLVVGGTSRLLPPGMAGLIKASAKLMLSYRDHHWVLLNGPSRFEAQIEAGMWRPEEVRWQLSLQYVAGGPQWRRVKQHERPCVDLEVGSFHLPGPKWTSLEEMNYWNTEDEESADPLSWMLGPPGGGYFDLYYRESSEAEPVMVNMGSCNWRVVERVGTRCAVELAADEGGGRLHIEPATDEVLVLPDGTVVPETEPEPEQSWKHRAHVYAVEQVPFGVVTVKVPRNAGDAAAFAHARVRKLLGVTRPPEYVTVHDLRHSEATSPCLGDELHVHLHYHGYYEDT